ncbi:MAG: phage portal protein [Rikenellaceae bacterium]
MKLFKFRKLEKRNNLSELEKAINEVLARNIEADSLHRGDDHIRHIHEESSLALSAVWACVRIISDSASMLPIHLYKRSESGRERDYTHPSYQVIRYPNDYSSRIDLIHFLVLSCTLWGNGYLRIYRDEFYRPTRLKMLYPYEVEPILDTFTDTLTYRISSGELLDSTDVIHLKNLTVNGYEGKSPIAVHRENLVLTSAAQKYGETFFTRGANTDGAFTIPTELSNESYVRLKTELIKSHSGMHNSHTPMLLEGGLKYERISIPPEDAQFIATRKFQKTEIATIFGVPPHMIADLDRATNNNIEHQGMEFVTYCLMPYLIKIEEEFNRKLLRFDESNKLYFAFGFKALLRGDAKTRSEVYKNLHLIGMMNPNEGRKAEDMNAYEGGDKFYVQSNMQSVDNVINQNNNE